MPGLLLPVMARASPTSPAAKPPPGLGITSRAYLSSGRPEAPRIAELVESLVGIVVQGRDIGLMRLELILAGKPGPVLALVNLLYPRLLSASRACRREHRDHDRQPADGKSLHCRFPGLRNTGQLWDRRLTCPDSTTRRESPANGNVGASRIMPSRPRLHASLARHWYDSLVYQPNTDEDIRFHN